MLQPMSLGGLGEEGTRRLLLCCCSGSGPGHAQSSGSKARAMQHLEVDPERPRLRLGDASVTALERKWQQGREQTQGNREIGVQGCGLLPSLVPEGSRRQRGWHWEWAGLREGPLSTKCLQA